jgi:hypothetical protein
MPTVPVSSVHRSFINLPAAPKRSIFLSPDLFHVSIAGRQQRKPSAFLAFCFEDERIQNKGAAAED